VISVTQASLGTKLQIPSLYGKVDITIAPGTQPNEVIKINDQGFYNAKENKRGDMVINLIIQVPRKLTPKQREILLLFAQTETAANFEM